ncbi:MAG: methyltransferase domain-containing protein [Myxococcales bacterium]|nr:methyltransferase domain-containing protein [Myxococcales bacterium]
MIPAPLDAALHGFMASHILFTAHALGVFAALDRAPATAAALAGPVGADPQALDRLLTACASLGLLKRDGDHFALPADLHPYLGAGPLSVDGWLTHLRDNTSRAFRGLTQRVREGAKAPAGSPFDAIFADPEATAGFAQSMWDIGYPAAVHLVGELDLSGHLVDVGGASGAFAIAAAEKASKLTATVFDLEPMRAPALAQIAAHGLTDRVDFQTGDFFHDAWPAADIYVLGYILSDWSDDQGTKLLRTAADALPKGGRLLILERLLDEDRAGPWQTTRMDIAMLLETHGRHRSATEYADWLRSVGLTDIHVHRSPQGKHLIGGWKR